jgi:hypothetical protein
VRLAIGFRFPRRTVIFLAAIASGQLEVIASSLFTDYRRTLVTVINVFIYF